MQQIVTECVDEKLSSEMREKKKRRKGKQIRKIKER